MGERGISLIAIIVTIIIIIILTTITGYYSQDILEKTERMRIEEEFRSVGEFVGNEKAKVMADIISIPGTYIAEDDEIDNYIDVLGSDASKIREVNNDPDVPANQKYHLMNQAAFDHVFGEDLNVRNITREYLINFYENVVIMKYGDKLYQSGEIE